jgi:hypothetical protein
MPAVEVDRRGRSADRPQPLNAPKPIRVHNCREILRRCSRNRRMTGTDRSRIPESRRMTRHRRSRSNRLRREMTPTVVHAPAARGTEGSGRARGVRTGRCGEPIGTGRRQGGRSQSGPFEGVGARGELAGTRPPTRSIAGLQSESEWVENRRHRCVDAGDDRAPLNSFDRFEG